MSVIDTFQFVNKVHFQVTLVSSGACSRSANKRRAIGNLAEVRESFK